MKKIKIELELNEKIVKKIEKLNDGRSIVKKFWRIIERILD